MNESFQKHRLQSNTCFYYLSCNKCILYHSPPSYMSLHQVPTDIIKSEMNVFKNAALSCTTSRLSSIDYIYK